MKIQPWMRCECGKLHVATFVVETTKCKCGRLLKPQFKVRSTESKPSDYKEL